MFLTERWSLFNQTFLHWQETLPEINICSLFHGYTFFLLWMQPWVHTLVQFTSGHTGWNTCRVEGLLHCNVPKGSLLHCHAVVLGLTSHLPGGILMDVMRHRSQWDVQVVQAWTASKKLYWAKGEEVFLHSPLIFQDIGPPAWTRNDTTTALNTVPSPVLVVPSLIHSRML